MLYSIDALNRNYTLLSVRLCWQVVFPDMRCRWFIPKRDDLHVISPLKQRLVTTVILSHSGWSGKLPHHSPSQWLELGTCFLALFALTTPHLNLLKREYAYFRLSSTPEHLNHQSLPLFKGPVAGWCTCAAFIDEKLENNTNRSKNFFFLNSISILASSITNYSLVNTEVRLRVERIYNRSESLVTFLNRFI